MHIFTKENKALLFELVRTDFKLRYQDSILGFAWSLLKPLLMFAILYLVFGKVMKVGTAIPHYPVYLLLGIVVWNFFVEASSQGIGAVVARGGLIRKVNFPKWIIVISGTISALINLGLSMVIIAIFMAINRVELSATILLFIPIIVEVYLFAVGIAFFLATANVKYRDTGHIYDIIIQAAFYATPILYPVALLVSVIGDLGKLLMINPMAQIIQDARFALVTHETVTTWSVFAGHLYLALIPVALVFVVLALGIRYFNKNAKNFAEMV